MSLTDQFANLLRHFRELRSFTQEDLAGRAGVDRTYIGQLERGEKSPTLTTIEKLASTLEVQPAMLLEELATTELAKLTVADDYIVRKGVLTSVSRDAVDVDFPPSVLLLAVDVAHGLIDQLYDVRIDIASLLGMRNLSAFVGELVAGGIQASAAGLFRRNPHQDGYPDLLLMDDRGTSAWLKLAGRLNEKRPFSPFATGGLEVKATCGAIPTPQACAKRGLNRPALGDTRIGCMTGYDWKAHHRQTNNLVGVLWDFLEGRPRVAALMYCSDLEPPDWGEIVQPKVGGGRTTSVSIMTQSGIRKMYGGWVCVLRHGKYGQLLNRRNGGTLIPPV